MAAEQARNLSLDGLRQKRARAVAQNLGQRIGKSSWLRELENISVGHGVSLLCWRSGGLEHPHDTPPYPFTPSPTFAHSSLIAPTEIAGSILHSLPSAVFVASSDAKDVRADRTRHEYAPGFLIKTPTGQPLIAVKGLQPEHGIPVIDVATGKASGIETDNLTFFTSWRIVTKVLDSTKQSAHSRLIMKTKNPWGRP